MEFPLVTVFTFIYNTNPRFIIEAIQSIRANNYPNLQHIIIDDCSPDARPKELVKKWISENNYTCEFYENTANLGICGNLNYVLTLAKGKYILGCCDDLITPDRILNDVLTFEKLDSSYALVFGLSQEINSKSELQPRVYPNLIIPEDDKYINLLLKGNCLSAPSVTLKTDVIKKIGGYNEKLVFEDYEMAMRLSFAGYRFKNIPKINAYYRVHDESISNQLNFEIENIRVLSQFSEEKGVREILYSKVWDLVFEKRNGYRESIEIFEKKYEKNRKLRLLRSSRNKFVLRVINKIFKSH